MRNILSKLTVIIVFMLIPKLAFNQNATINQDSLSAIELLSRAELNIDKIISLNPNGFKLNLTKKEALIVTKNILNSTYGKSQIRKQKPFHIIKTGRYWVVWGSFNRKGKGGVFEIIINSENSCVEYLSHGK
jgi:hypothetical protein